MNDDEYPKSQIYHAYTTSLRGEYNTHKPGYVQLKK
jgi:hypothetical protein